MKKYTFYLVGLVALVLSSCNKNKLYYPADFYQGTMQTCIDKNNIYVDTYRTFSHVNKNAIYFFDDFPANHFIEYDFAKNKLDTLYSPMAMSLSPNYYPSDFYLVNRDSIFMATMYKYYWANTWPNSRYISFSGINDFIDDSVYYFCLGSVGMYSQMTIIDGKYIVAPVIKYGLKKYNTCSLHNQWRDNYDQLKDWDRNHYVRFCMTNDSISDVKLFCSGDWISSHPRDVYLNDSYGIGNIYLPQKERFYFFTQHTMEIAVADKEGNYIESIMLESQFFIKHHSFSSEDSFNQTKTSKYAKSITFLSNLYYDEYRDVFLRVLHLPVRVSEDGMQELPKDFVIMVFDGDLDKMYEVYFEGRNYTGSIHITEKGVYLLKTDTDESNRYYKADRFIFD